MSPSDQSMLKTLDLLVTISHSRAKFPPGLSDEEKDTIIINRQLISDTGLTIFQFISAIRKLGNRGYTSHQIFYDERLRTQLDEELKKLELESELKKLEVLDTEENSEKMKSATVKGLNRVAPPGKKLDPEELKDEFIKISDLSRKGIEAYKKLKPEELGYVWLMPFRSLERLHNKMNGGMSFEHVQDTDIWYDHDKKILYVGSTKFLTNYRGTTSRTHFILSSLFKNLDKGLTIGYDEVEEFEETTNGNKKHYDSMRHFVKDNGKLKDIFQIFTDRVGINPKYKNDVH